MASRIEVLTEPELWKGFVAGVAGGIGATIAMTAFQQLWTTARHHLRTGEGSSNATEKLTRGFFRYDLDERARSLAGSAVNLGFGTAAGAVYGVVAEYSPEIAGRGGVAFGTGLGTMADELALPVLGSSLARSPIPWSTRLFALCSHALYGAVLETLRRSVRRLL